MFLKKKFHLPTTLQYTDLLVKAQLLFVRRQKQLFQGGNRRAKVRPST
jgi:hypothetical protein